MCPSDSCLPASPCIGVCVLDTAGICSGCLRDRTEVAAWPQAGAEERRRILEQVKRRREACDAEPRASCSRP